MCYYRLKSSNRRVADTLVIVSFPSIEDAQWSAFERRYNTRLFPSPRTANGCYVSSLRNYHVL